MHYVKLWTNLIRSSILEQELPVRWLWIVLLLEADQSGNVYGTQEVLARIANLTLNEVKQALVVLMAPDPSSTTDEEEGRRLLNPSANLWYIVNYHKYRGIKDIAQEREKTKERVRRHRERRRLGTLPVTQDVADVTESVTHSNPIVDVDVDVEVDVKNERRYFAPPTPEEVQAYITEKRYHFTAEDFIAYYASQGWKKANGRPVTDWKGCCRTWEKRERPSIPQSRIDGVCGRCHGANPENWTVCAACLKELGSTDIEIEQTRTEVSHAPTS